MNLQTTHDSDVAAIEVQGEVDAASAYDLYVAALALAEPGVVTVALDLAAVTFIDSVGLGMLVRIRDELHGNHRIALRLRAPSERVMSLLTMTALAGEFDIVS